MARPASERGRRRGLAGWLLRLGLALLALVAVLAVAAAFFPFQRLAPALAARIERESGASTRIAGLRVALGLRGPELALQDVTLRWPTGDTLSVPSLRVRGARPAAWLRGAPTAHVVLRAPFGAFEGEVSRERVRGELAGFDLAQLPAAWFGEGGSPLAGPLDVRFDFARSGTHWTGDATLSGAEGSLALPGAPIALPYERLDAAARLDPEGTLHLASLDVVGPMVSARARGTIAAGPGGPASGAIAIAAEVERLDPGLLPALRQAGVSSLGADGAGRITVSGIPERIQLR
jgi:type II secretion system protein N